MISTSQGNKDLFAKEPWRVPSKRCSKERTTIHHSFHDVYFHIRVALRKRSRKIPLLRYFPSRNYSRIVPFSLRRRKCLRLLPSLSESGYFPTPSPTRGCRNIVSRQTRFLPSIGSSPLINRGRGNSRGFTRSKCAISILRIYAERSNRISRCNVVKKDSRTV